MNTKEQIDNLSRKAEAGDALAQNSLGCAYHNADGVERDYGKAKEWYEKSAAQGNMYAQSNLGVLYKYGLGVEKNLSKAFEWYMKSAIQGYSLAQESVAIAYDYGYGVDKDYAKAVEWYKKAAEKGRCVAQNNLGSKYQHGQGIEKNLTLAFKWYEKAALQDEEFAQCNLGILYEEGKGVKVNLKLAAYWYRKSAKQGHKRAVDRLKALEARYDDHLDTRLINVPSFAKNPFRLIGIYSNSSARDIAANKSRMSAFLRIGRNVSFPSDSILEAFYRPLYDDVSTDGVNDDKSLTVEDVYKQIKNKEADSSEEELSQLKALYEYKCRELYRINRSQEMVDEALASINQPSDRIKYALFWFIKVTAVDEIGLNNLIQGNISKAEEIFSKQEDFSSLINRAILAFMNDEDDTFVSCITKVIHEEDLRNDFISSVCGDNFQMTEDELAHLFIDTLFAELPNENWKEIFYEDGTSGDDDDYISDIVAKEPIDKLTEAISKCSSVSRSNGAERYKQGNTLMELAKEQLPILEDLIGEDELRYQQIADKTAREILNCGIDYFKACGDTVYSATSRSLALNEYANSIAVGATLKERTKDCLAQIKAKSENMPPESAFKLFSQIHSKISDFSMKPDLIKYSDELLSATLPLLCEVKETLGTTNPAYLSISTEVAGNALVNVIAEVNEKFEAVDRAYKANNGLSVGMLTAMNSLKDSLKAGWQVFLNIDLLNLEHDFVADRYQPNRDIIKKHLDDFRVSIYGMKATLQFKTETEIYNAATTIYLLNQYIQKFPQGKYVTQARNKVAALIKADDDYWKTCQQKGDFNGYLAKYRFGRHSKDAQAEIQKKRDQEDDNYWTACSQNGDYDEYLKKYPKGRHANEANKQIEKRKTAKNWIIAILIVVAIFGGIAAIWGAQGFVFFFGGIAFLAFCGATGKGDLDCGPRLICLIVAAIAGLIAYGIASAYNI